MKKSHMMLMSMLVVVLAGVALVACTPGGGSAVEETAAQPTAAAAGETKTLFVGPELVECTGVGPMECMQVRESLDAPYTYFYDMIEGFEYEPGYEYELLVNVTTVDNPPADGSSLKYTLVELVSKTPAAAAGETKTLFVGPELVECTGVGPMECMQVRESLDAPYTYFYDMIEGFEYEPGYEYELLVNVTMVDNPPADGSSLKYTLVELVSKTPAAAAGETKTLFVGPELVECTGVGPMECMQVRESLDAPYTFFYSQIEGFEYEPGYEYELIVNVTELEDVPADAPSLKYTLVELVSKTAVGESSGLEGTRWTLESVADADGNLVAAAPGSQATAEFKDGQVGGNSSCNSYGGSYTVDGDTLTVGPLAMTMMACLDESLMAQEAAFGAAMQAAAGYAIVDGKLEIYDAAGQTVLVFAAAPSTDLAGSSWVAEAVNNGREAVTSVVAGTEITLEFGADGMLSGSSGCNRYNANYALDGESITIGQPAGTKMLCDGEGVMEQEAAFLALLPQAATYSVSGDRLELRTADGALIGGFEPAAAAAPDGTVSVAMLEGPEWQLTGYLNADGETVAVVEGSQATATFMNGQVSGRGSCNSYGGQYALDGEALTISETFSTMMACEESLMAQEQAFLGNLSAAAGYRIDGTTLDILDADGAIVLTFVAN